MSTLAAGSAVIPHIIEDGASAPRRRTGATRFVAVVRRGIVGTVALALMMLGFVLGTPNAHATDQTAIDAKIGPSLVYISTAYSSNLLIPGSMFDDGKSRWEGPVLTGGTCSGVVVDPAGYIATDGHCVDSSSLEAKAEVIRAVMRGDGVKWKGLAPDMSPDALRKLVNTALNQEWLIEGRDASSPPDRTVQVIQPMGPGRVISEWTTAQVVDFQKVDNEDNALLKVSNMPPLAALPVASEAPAPGTAITSAGFPGDVGENMDQSRSQPPSFKEGSVSSRQVQPNGAARTEVSAAQTNGMSGGPVVNNATGEVIGLCDYGMVNRQTGDIEGGINFVTDAAALHSFLLKNGVHLVAPAAPVQPFPWVWVAVGGAAVVVLLALSGVLVVRRRAKRRTVPPIDGSQLLQPAPSGQPVPQPVAASQQSPTVTPQPPRDVQSDLAAAKPDDLASIAPEVMTPTPNGTVEIK
jgi:serine protease Do